MEKEVIRRRSKTGANVPSINRLLQSQLITTKNTAMVKATQKNAIIHLPHRVADSASNRASASANNCARRTRYEKPGTATKPRASQHRAAADSQGGNDGEQNTHRTFPRRRNYRFCVLTVDKYELLMGALVVGLPISDPSFQRGFTRSLHGRPSTNGFPALSNGSVTER